LRQPKDPLDNDLRAEMMTLLDEMEVTTEEVRGYLPGALTLGTVAYHLLVLEQAGLIERVGGVWRLKR
jgi:DNA-binding transcriptional ArsR family regulator